MQLTAVSTQLGRYLQEYDHVDDEKDPVLECFTIRPQQLLQNSWAIKLGLIQDPAIVEANHRYWYCAACALVLVLWQARMLNKPPTPHPVKLEEKLGMPTLGWLPALVGSLEFPT